MLVVLLQGCVNILVEYEKQQLNVMGPIGLAFGCFQVSAVHVIMLATTRLVHNNKLFMMLEPT